MQYGDFEGGIVNVVTKSGSNSFHGSADYEYDSNGESGHSIGSDAIYAGVESLKPANAPSRLITTTFTDKDSSVTIGGPLWPDHMFFFFGYDSYQGSGGSVFVPQDVAGAQPDHRRHRGQCNDRARHPQRRALQLQLAELRRHARRC